MLPRTILTCVLIASGGIAQAQPGPAAPPASFSLTSSANGTNVAPGTLISWSMVVTVEAGTSLGLSGFSVDLVQAPTNPTTLDLVPASPVPAIMAGFSRPQGISNPTAQGGSAYGGVPMGVPGAFDLREIGGAQNTFGVAAAGIGLDVTPDTGIGQGGQPEVIAQGTFSAPGVAGQYCFAPENAFATLLIMIGASGQPSGVIAARVEAFSGFCFTVTAPACDADVNCDFALDGFDVEAQERAVGGDMTDYCLPDPDFNRDFALDGFDVDAVELVVGGGPCP